MVVYPSMIPSILPLGSSAPRRKVSPYVPYYYQDPISVDRKLISAVAENWSDEIAAFRDFAVTRGERRFTAAVVSSGLSLASQASRVTWVRYAFKGMVRFIPIIGWGMLAYDLYNLGEDLDLY